MASRRDPAVHLTDPLAADVPEPPSATRGARVLVVHGHDGTRDWLRKRFAPFWEVETVRDRAEALESARRSRPAIVLAALATPESDGLRLLAALREDPSTQALPVILLGGKAEEGPRLEALRAGADDYLVPPFDARELVARVNAQIELARLRDAAADQIGESERRLRIATTAARLGVFQWDLATDTATWDNARMYDIFGRTVDAGPASRAEFLNGMLHPDDVATFAAELDAAAAPGGTLRGQCRIRRQNDGASRWIEYWGDFTRGPDGRAQTLVGVIADVTERRLAEDVLRESERTVRASEARLRRLVESDMIGILFWDEDGRVTDANGAFLRMVGRTHADVDAERVDWRALVAPEFLDRHLHGLEEIRAGGTSTPIASELVRADGTRVPILCAGASLETAPLRGVTWVLDVSAQRRIEEEREELLRAADQARGEAEAANRAKDQFLAMLGHELRNPLSAVRNAIVTARADDERRERALDIARRQTDQLAHLIDDLLDVARITHGRIALRRTNLDLGTIVDRAFETTRGLIEDRGQTFTFSQPTGRITVEADAARLEQVIVNLLTNAAKYTEPAGQITLSTERAGDEVVLRVRDTGIGMSADLLSRVFELFAQADRSLDRSQGGLGIGLTLVKRIVELHGGRAEAFSEGPGKGSEFVVRLPAVETSAPEQSVLQALPARSASSRVILVEDNPDAAESLKLLLELLGHHVRVFPDGLAALEAARNEVPDVMLVDIGLPGIDGFEVARRARGDAALDDVVLVALTGYGRAEDRERSRAAGFDHHLVKPVDPQQLHGLVSQLARSDAPSSTIH